MADNDKGTAAADAPAPTYQAINLDQLPRRNAGPRIDLDAANALLALVTADEKQGATDGIVYDTSEKARTAGLRASRMLAHVAPAGKVASVRTGELPDNAGWAFAVTLKDAKARE